MDSGKITVYLRDSGPICYEASLWKLISDLPQGLLASGLNWYWESEPSNPTASTSEVRDLPPERSLTLLTQENASELVSDFRERDIDDIGRFIAIFGVDSNIPPSQFDRAKLAASLADFTQREEGPIRAVIIQLGDSPWEHIFIPHNPVDPVKRLMKSFSLMSADGYEKLPYKKLYTARLEALVDAIVALGSLRA